MKSAVALFMGILMLAGSLFPQTDVEEVYKIPGMIAHYKVHKRDAGADFNFQQFLELHYSIASKHAQTPHKGAELPMYNHLSSGFVFILAQLQWKPDERFEFIVLMPLRFAYQNLYSFQTASLLFQPPRLG